MFDLDQFIADLGAARTNPLAVRDVMARAVAEPDAVMKVLGEPLRAGVRGLYRSPELTVLNLVWGPGMSVMPHNHNMWAVIGIYSGREDNLFWRRLPNDAKGRIEAAGAKSLGDRDVHPLGHDIIHSVLNPRPAIHRDDPRLRWRIRRGRAKRVGLRGADGAALQS